MVKHLKIGNMTKQNKKLLLKDLCARLPYGVKVKSGRRRIPVTLSLNVMSDFYLGHSIKPYLRTMDSMTEEEREIYNNMTYVEGERYISSEICSNVINFLNAHHIDFRGWIKKGLALPAPEGMYNF